MKTLKELRSLQDLDKKRELWLDRFMWIAIFIVGLGILATIFLPY